MLGVVMVFGFLACFIASFFISKILYRKCLNKGNSKATSGILAGISYGLVTTIFLVVFTFSFPMEKYKAEEKSKQEEEVLRAKQEQDSQALKTRQEQEAKVKANEDKDRSVMAGILCENHVEERLKSPATADFPMFDRNIWKMPNQRYVVKSYVDAQNSFGANLRTHWFCEIKYKGQGDEADKSNWELIKISLDE